MDTQLQNFCTESINKEAFIRFAWHSRYSKQFCKRPFNPKPKKTGLNLNTTFVSEKIKQMETERKPPRSAPAKRGSTRQDTRLNKSDGALAMRDMRPPSSSTRSLLYSGISAHGEGRYAYLKKRKTLTPVQKYEFPLLSSYQYGWKIMEYANPKPSPHARVYIDSLFYRKRGITFGWRRTLIVCDWKLIHAYLTSQSVYYKLSVFGCIYICMNFLDDHKTK